MWLLFAVALSSWSMTEQVSGPTGSLFDLRTDGEAIYWLECPVVMSPCSLERLSTNEKEPTTVAKDFELGGVYALEGDSVYMTKSGDILRLPKRGGKPRVLAKVDGWIQDLQIAGDWVYVSTADTYMMDGENPNPRHGTIVRFPKAGGAVKKIAATSSSMPRMAIDDRRVYFIGDTSIQSVPVGGGPVKTLTADETNVVMSIAADRDSIYFAAGGEVRRIPKNGGAVSVLYKAEIILKVRVQDGFVYASQNLAFMGGGVTAPAAIIRIPIAGGKAEVLASPSQSPQDMAVSRAGVFVLLSELGGKDPDRIVALGIR